MEITNPAEKIPKQRNTADLLTVFSDRVNVRFVKSDGSVELLSGRWCTVCK